MQLFLLNLNLSNLKIFYHFAAICLIQFLQTGALNSPALV